MQYRTIPLLLIFLLSTAMPVNSQDSHSPFFTLKEAIHKALRDNATVRETTERRKAMVQSLSAADAGFLPRLSASFTYSRLQDEPYVVFDPYRIDIGDRDRAHWDITIAQPVFSGFALTSRKRIAEAGVSEEEARGLKAARDITRDLKTAYYDILLTQKFLDVATEAVNQLKAHVSDAEKFYGQGLIPYNDLLKSKVALARAVQDRRKAESNHEMAVSALNRLLRLPLNSRTRVEEIPVPGHIGLDLEELQARSVAERPELKIMRKAIEQATHRITLARSAYYPKITLAGTYEQNGDNFAATRNDYGNTHNAAVTLEAKWNLFEWGKTKSEVARAMHEKAALDEKLSAMEDLVQMEVKKAYLDLEVAWSNIETARRAQEQAEENFRITKLQYASQMATSTDVLDARTFLTRAETDYYSASYGYLKAMARLERAVGGPVTE